MQFFPKISREQGHCLRLPPNHMSWRSIGGAGILPAIYSASTEAHATGIRRQRFRRYEFFYPSSIFPSPLFPVPFFLEPNPCSLPPSRPCYDFWMRTIVTGGAGFIGSNLVMALQAQGSSGPITVIDDFSSADFKNLRGYKGDVIALPCEDCDLDYLLGGKEIGVVYHLASITDTTMTDQRQMVERNVEGFRNVLNFAASKGASVVYASSGATYGQVEGVMREDREPAPANVYGFSKLILDNMAAEYAGRGVPVAGVRYFNVYGPNEAHKGKMASMVYQLYLQVKRGEKPKVFSEGQHKRDFVYVKDAVKGTILAGQKQASGVFNIGSGTATSFNEIIKYIGKALGQDLQPEYIDNPFEAFYQNHTEAELSNSKAKLGYLPDWSPAKGVADYIEWLEQQGV